MRARATLNGQLIGRQMGLLAVLLTVIGLSLFLILRTVLLDAVARSMHGEIAVLAPIIHRTLHSGTPQDFSHFARLLMAHLRGPGVDVLVSNAEGHIIARSTPLIKTAPPLFNGPYFLWNGHIVVDAPLGNPFYPHGYVWLLTALAPSQRVLQRVVELYAVLALAVLGLAGWLGSVSVRKTLAPLGQIRDSTVKIAAGQFGHTTDIAHAPRELAELGDAINSMSVAIHDLFRQEKALSEQMRRFVADASHELRTPLTAITGFLDLIDRGGLTAEEERRGRAAVRKQGQRMAQLVNQLLTLSHVDSAPEGQIQLAPVALDQWLTDILPIAEGLVAPRPLTVETEPVVVRADADRLSEVLFNLLDNAARYTPADGEIAVTVAAEPAYGVLTVADRGAGIPPDDVPHIFERFYRSDRARSSASGGSGLGLAIVDTLVRAHGGQVTVANRPAPDHGAIFTVRLPRVSN
ncbi:MAG: HAMP domain-containing sensor histidine kinase [Thermaerobacter sp.]|nr:HAMP domain-containing sensor histidine kinase [Thermaerobacter sp.]